MFEFHDEPERKNRDLLGAKVRAPIVQRSLRVGPSGDPLEHEADRTADWVVARLRSAASGDRVVRNDSVPDGGERGGGVARVRRADGLLIQRDENQDRIDFLAGDHFRVTDFTPSTGSGHFDLDYDRAAGTCEVKVKLNIDMLSVATPNGRSWTPETADQWVATAQQRIRDQWNDKFDFLLTRPDWPELRVTPRFVIEVGYTLMEDFAKGRQIGPAKAGGARRPRDAHARRGAGGVTAGDPGTTNAHYNVDVFAGSKNQWSLARDEIGFGDADERMAAARGGKDAHVVNDALQAKTADPLLARQAGCAAFHEDSADFMTHNAYFLQTIGESEKRILDGLLGDGGLDVNFNWKGPIGDRSTVRLNEFASRVSKVYPPMALRYPLVIQGNAVRARRVRDYLVGRGMTNRFEIDGRVEIGSVTITTKPDYVVTAADDVGSQATIAHEFGHMLGLADEYNSTTEATRQNLADRDGERALDQTSLDAMTQMGAGAPKFANQQLGEVELADQAGVDSPNTWGAKTNSIMNSGDLLLPHHLVTVWEALGRATRTYIQPTWWKIVPAE